MTVHSSVGLATSGALSTYEVRTITKGRAADNKPYVSSQTGGKTHRKAGNVDATWDVSLYAPANTTEVPAALKPGQTISVQLTNDTKAYKMIIDSSSLEVDIEGGELVGISLGCSAVDDDSY